jgi:hypothetical protein
MLAPTASESSGLEICGVSTKVVRPPCGDCGGAIRYLREEAETVGVLNEWIADGLLISEALIIAQAKRIAAIGSGERRPGGACIGFDLRALVDLSSLSSSSSLCLWFTPPKFSVTRS